MMDDEDDRWDYGSVAREWQIAGAIFGVIAGALLAVTVAWLIRALWG